MRKIASCLVLSGVLVAGLPSSNAQAAWFWYVVAECNMRANIATMGIRITDKRGAYNYELNRCLAEYY